MEHSSEETLDELIARATAELRQPLSLDEQFVFRAILLQLRNATGVLGGRSRTCAVNTKFLI